MTSRTVLGVLTVLALAAPQLHAEQNAARLLVGLARPHERELQALRFMFAVSPFRDTPAGFEQCVVQSASAGLQSLFERLFAERLSAEDLRAAIDFYRRREAQAGVDALNAHEQRQFDIALRGGQAASEQPAHSQASLAAMRRFAATPAGRLFGESPLDREPSVRREIDALRGAAFATCAKVPLPTR